MTIKSGIGRVRAVVGLSLASLALSGIAAAAAAGGSDTLQEIVVTAQKRKEDVQQVPIAITAISSSVLQQKGITSVDQLSNMAPNVNLDAGTPFSGSDTVLSAYIRGIGQDDFAFNLDPGVGVYVDGVYLARSVGANTTMLDVSRVEILKGPQGTLFGRNSIGGAISIVTRDPGKKFMAKGEVTGGTYHRLDTNLSFDIPFTDRILSTVSFSSQKRDGYQRRIPYVQTNVNGSAGIPDCTTPTCPYIVDAPQAFPAAGYGGGDTQGGVNKWAVRGKIVFLINDDVKLTATADFLNVDQSASANTVLSIGGLPGGLSAISNLCLLGVTGPFGALCTSTRGGLSPTPTPMPVSTPLAPNGVGLNVDGNPYNNYLPYDSRFQTNNIDLTYANGNNFSKLQNPGFATILDWKLAHGMNFKWIQSYRDLKWSVGMNLDGSPEQILRTSFNMVQHQVSEELQLNGTAVNDRLNYATGLYYFREAGHLHDFVTFPMGILQVDGPNDLSTEAEAIYAHLNFKITDHWGFTAGGRETFEHKTFQGYQTDDNGLSYKISGCVNPTGPNVFGIPGTPPPTCQQALGFPVPGSPYTYYPVGPFHQNYTNFSPTVGFEYHVNPDMMFYTSYSQGYKTGSWTTRLSSPHPTYDSELHFGPEFAKAEELGMKSELFQHRMRLNVAAFHTKYDNIQLNSQVGISPTIVNAGNATIYGLEVEAQALVTPHFSFTTGLGYTHAAYDSLNNVGDNGYSLTLHSCPERDPGAPAPGPTVAQTYQNGVCQLPKTPKFKGSLSPQYVFDLPNEGSLTLGADYTYITKEYNDIGNSWQLARPDLSLVDANITYKEPNGEWQVALGGTNLTDKRYVVSGQNQGGVPVVDASYNPPRMWYATFRFNLGGSRK